MGKHEKIKFDYSKYFNFIYSCRKCNLSYPENELLNGICIFCREEDKYLKKLIHEITLTNDRIKFKKLQQYNKYLTK